MANTDSTIVAGSRVKDETGNVYGKLTVIERGSPGRRASWTCRCECGAVVTVAGVSLRSGNTKSCSRSCARTRHGHAIKGKRTPEYRCWCGILARCDNPATDCYANYGWRGVRVCAGWRVFDAFIFDMGSRLSAKHSIDRIDNDGNYSCGKCAECKTNGWPMNCRWATKAAQDNNRRTNHRLEFQGESRTISEWARLLGVHQSTIHLRLKSRWPIERILSPSG